MVIHIHPNRIHTAGAGAGKALLRRPEAQAAPSAPRRAALNYIPSAEALRTLVAGAVESLRRGVRWDRGSILNILA